jgi:hypothetical protein
MPMFRKKPVVIEARQYHPKNWDDPVWSDLDLSLLPTKRTGFMNTSPAITPSSSILRIRHTSTYCAQSSDGSSR